MPATAAADPLVRGLFVSLDGFSAGFGSFEYVQRLPLEQIKIDFPRPRPLSLRETPEFGRHVAHIRQLFGIADGAGDSHE